MDINEIGNIQNINFNNASSTATSTLPEINSFPQFADSECCTVFITKSCEYTYGMTVRILGIPMFFEEKDRNLRKALCKAFAKAQNWSIENGNTGSGVE